MGYSRFERFFWILGARMKKLPELHKIDLKDIDKHLADESVAHSKLEEKWQSKFNDLIWTNSEGIEIKPFYSAEDIKEVHQKESFPGLAPFLQGPYSSMYLSRPWTIRQYGSERPISCF